MAKKKAEAELGKDWLKHVLASLFLLTYTDVRHLLTALGHGNVLKCPPVAY